MRFITCIFSLIFCFLGGASVTPAQRGKAPPKSPVERKITVNTEPLAAVWLDGVLQGTTDEAGRLALKLVPAGAHRIRVRVDGFREVEQNLTAAQKGVIRIKLAKTTDPAELAYQNAERTAAADKGQAGELYRRAIKDRPAYAEAYVGLARVLADLGETEDAHQAIAGARKARAAYPEASAVEGRIFKSEGDEAKAVAAFRRAIREGKGFQPEAYTGLALLYKEKAETVGDSGDFEGEQENYQESIKSFAPAVKQLGGAPDAIIVYQIYGLVLEKMGRDEEAIGVYEDFLRKFPDSSEANAVRSFIAQLSKQP